MTKTSLFHDRTRLEVIWTRKEVIRTRLEIIRSRLEGFRTSQFLGGCSNGQDQELGRVSEISNMFDILATRNDKPGNHNRC